MMTQEWQGNKYYDDTGMTRICTNSEHVCADITKTRLVSRLSHTMWLIPYNILNFLQLMLKHVFYRSWYTGLGESYILCMTDDWLALFWLHWPRPPASICYVWNWCMTMIGKEQDNAWAANKLSSAQVGRSTMVWFKKESSPVTRYHKTHYLCMTRRRVIALSQDTAWHTVYSDVHTSSLFLIGWKKQSKLPVCTWVKWVID